LAVNYPTFGSGSRKLIGNLARTDANDVILRCYTIRTLKIAYSSSILTVFGKFEPLNVIGHRLDPKSTVTRNLSHHALKSTHMSLQ